MNKTHAIIIDLDGTLADITDRQHHLQAKKDWKSFFAGIPNDRINSWCKAIIEKFRIDYKIIIVTGRPRDYETTTIAWLNRFDVKYDEIFFRRAGDNRSDDIVKKEIYEANIKPNYNVLFVVDDRKRVVDMWRAQGLVCLQCDVGDF